MNKLFYGDNTFDLCRIDLSFIENKHFGIIKLFMTDLQYISDAKGNPVGVIVPIEIWHEIESEQETAYLTKSETMKNRLLEAKERSENGDDFWLSAIEDSLKEIWNNEEDDIYAELLEK